MSSFSLVLTSPGEHGAPVEIFALQDSRRASRREVQLNFALPQTTPDAEQQHVGDPLVTTIGSFAYDVKYTGKDAQKTHQDTTPILPPSAPTSTPDLLTPPNDEMSSASTTELDLNREFEREMDTETETEPATTFPNRPLDRFSPPPRRRRPPFREFEFDSDIESETATTTRSESDVEEMSGERNAPVHRQPAALASLAQAPMLPPRFRKLYASTGNDIPMRVLGQDAGASASAAPRSFESDGEDEDEDEAGRAPPPSGAPAGRFNRATLRALNVFRSLWRRLRQVGALIVRECTKDI